MITGSNMLGGTIPPFHVGRQKDSPNPCRTRTLSFFENFHKILQKSDFHWHDDSHFLKKESQIEPLANLESISIGKIIAVV